MSHGLTRLQSRFQSEPDDVARAQKTIGEALDAEAAESRGLVTFALDDVDWDDEVRVFLEERASFSPDSLNRQIGEFKDIEATPDGILIDDATWTKRRNEWLPSTDDGDFVASLMVPVSEPGQYAPWISPPRVGIDNRPGDFEYVKIETSLSIKPGPDLRVSESALRSSAGLAREIGARSLGTIDHDRGSASWSIVPPKRASKRSAAGCRGSPPIPAPR